MSMLFSSREDAGRELGAWLSGRGIKPDIVLGLPRGGVPVAAQVAAILQCPLDVLVVRKIGHPRQREFAVGALAEPDVVLLDSHSAQSTHAAGDDLRKVIEEETGRLREYLAKFHRGSPLTLEGKIVLIIDDGVATGATAEAAIIAARKLGAARVLAASPVASSHAEARLKPISDGFHALFVDPDFGAVGQYYRHFSQTTDEEVLALIHGHA